MKKIEIMADRNDYLSIRLYMERKKSVDINIVKNTFKNCWTWSYSHFKYEGWETVKVKEKRFLAEENNKIENSKENSKEINDAFYEVIRQLKYHPSYRLKVMNMLDDEIRKVWDLI